MQLIGEYTGVVSTGRKTQAGGNAFSSILEKTMLRLQKTVTRGREVREATG